MSSQHRSNLEDGGQGESASRTTLLTAKAAAKQEADLRGLVKTWRSHIEKHGLIRSSPLKLLLRKVHERQTYCHHPAVPDPLLYAPSHRFFLSLTLFFATKYLGRSTCVSSSALARSCRCPSRPILLST